MSDLADLSLLDGAHAGGGREGGRPIRRALTRNVRLSVNATLA